MAPRPLRILDCTLPSPAENLALEEAILEAVEAGTSPPTLRFWESTSRFVVLGVGQRLAQEVHLDHCRADGVDVQRRCSAGGCVLQGPGSLNYALTLPFAEWPELRDLRASYCAILGNLVGALATAGVDAAVMGTSDLALHGKKFSGNAQKRKRGTVLHHGTILYGAGPGNFTRYLEEPADRPAYRAERDHDAFVAPLALPADHIRALITSAFAPLPPTPGMVLPHEHTASQRLSTEKYGRWEWIGRR